MQRRNVKYGISLVILTVIIVNIKSFIRSNSDKVKVQEKPYSNRIDKLELMEEGERVSQGLDDNIGQIFTSVIISLDALPFLMKKNPEEAEQNIKELSKLARKGLDYVRNSFIALK